MRDFAVCQIVDAYADSLQGCGPGTPRWETRPSMRRTRNTSGRAPLRSNRSTFEWLEAIRGMMSGATESQTMGRWSKLFVSDQNTVRSFSVASRWRKDAW